MAKRKFQHILIYKILRKIKFGGRILECVEICGGKPLSGRVEIQGSKNAVLPILAGCILHRGISRINHCPRIRDVFDTTELLEILGCQVWWEGNCLAVDASRVRGWQIPIQIASRMRSSILFLGALLGRVGKAQLPYPGGCVLGDRPVDLHLQAMEEMGAGIEEENGRIRAEAEELQGREITLRFPSVGATENIILAAVCARGMTIIRNGAREPEIEELCSFFREKGADIRRQEDGSLSIRGGKELTDSRHDLAADRIVAGTYLMAAAVTNGCVTLGRMPSEHLKEVLHTMKQMGIRMEKMGKDLKVDGRGPRSAPERIETAPYPGFPTDLQSPMMALLAVTEGTCCIRENIFESRFETAFQLQKMGAKIEVKGREARVTGIPRLYGNWVEARELRGAAALFLAGLNAAGITQIKGFGYISRGYETICEDMKNLGAQVRIIE